MSDTEMTTLRIAAPDTVLDGATAVHYEGSFALELLEDGEQVRSAGDGTGACEVVTPSGVLRLDVGDWMLRTQDGRVARTQYDLTTLNLV